MTVTPINTTHLAHPGSIDAYIRAGFYLVPIPPGSKGPKTKGWNLRENAIRSQHDLPAGYGIGIAHAYSMTMALDIDDWELAKVELGLNGIDLDALYNAPDAVIIDSGRAGHGKLLYKVRKVHPSKKLMTYNPLTGQTHNYLDFRCATHNRLTVQDVLPPTIHPDTRQPYRWAGRGQWSNLPFIPDALLDYWQSLLRKDRDRTIACGDPIDASWEDIHSALATLSPDCSREEWIQIGMALHWAGSQTGKIDQALQLWNDWSSQSADKYPGERGVIGQWYSFHMDKQNPVTLGTLFHLAHDQGWSRPVNIEGLFKAVDPATIAEPVRLTDSLRPVPPDVDVSVFPELLRIRATEVSETVGCDPLVPLWAGLGAISAVVDTRSRLELMPGYQVPPIIWAMTIGDPGDKKSPGSIPMLSPLKSIELEDKPRYKRAFLDWEGLEAMHAASKKAYLGSAASVEAVLGIELPTVTDLPPQPVPLRLTVSDITSQKLVRLAADRPAGLLCHLDEMAGWIHKLTDKSTGEDRSTWVVAYEGKHYDMDRVGSGTISCENLAISVYGNVQPNLLRKTVNAMSQDGLLQRFIPAVLRHEYTKRGNPVPIESTHSAQWENLLRLIHALPIMTYRLSDDAYYIFREFQSWYEQRSRDERILDANDLFMTALGKIEGTTGRIALLFHLVESPWSTLVSGDLMKRVIRFVQYYIIPSFRYTFAEITDNDSGFDAWLADYIICFSSEKQTLGIAELRANAKRKMNDATGWQLDQRIFDSMALMETAKWVTPIELDIIKRKGTWAINPNLAVMFEEYRRKRIEAKHRRAQNLAKGNNIPDSMFHPPKYIPDDLKRGK